MPRDMVHSEVLLAVATAAIAKLDRRMDQFTSRGPKQLST